MPYIFLTVQSGGWDPELPINMDYSPELDPEIHGFLREQQTSKNNKKESRSAGSAATHCELRLILDGLEKLGFQLVTTTNYNFQGRSYNEFIMHRELSPADVAVVDKKKQTTVKSEPSPATANKSNNKVNNKPFYY